MEEKSKCPKCNGEVRVEGNKEICLECGHVNIVLTVHKSMIDQRAIFDRSIKNRVI